MNVEKEVKNTSLTFFDHKQPSKCGNIPVRNAMSTVKRSKPNVKSNFKPLRLKDLTQEMLEAQDEPLGNLAEIEADENAEDENLDLQKSSEPSSSTSLKREESPKNKPKYEKDLDLGVSWLETPAKCNGNVKATCIITPKPKCKLFPASLNSRKEFITPTVTQKLRKDEKCASALRIQCTVNSKSVLKTPLNKIECTPQNTIGSMNKNKTPCSTKSNITNSNSIIQRNKENTRINNAKPRVQFSTPIIERDDLFGEIKVKNVTYVILNILGRGGSSTVYHCYDRDLQIERAVKKVNLSSDTNATGYINEVKLLDKLQTCNRIIKIFDYEIIKTEKVLLVVLEKGGSDLSKILKNLSSTTEHLPMYMLIFYWMEMLYAVKQIHDNGIIHSDLKPANFLRVEDGLKLIDFGIASCIQNDMTSVVRNTPIGSFNYISPEALTNQSSNNCDSPSFGKAKYKVSYKSDVWSLGCILYQLVYRKTPFQHIGHMWAKISAIMDPRHKIDYPDVKWVPSKIVNTIKSCLQFDIKSRPSIDDLIKEYESIYN